jgi:hypothetical protein
MRNFNKIATAHENDIFHMNALTGVFGFLRAQAHISKKVML